MENSAVETAAHSAEHFDHQYNIRPGAALPFGASIREGGVNFSIYSRRATGCTLVLFHEGDVEPFLEIPIPDTYRLGDVFAVFVEGLDPAHIEYGYRMHGPDEASLQFDPQAILLDPYAKAVGGRGIWGKRFDLENPFQHRGRIVDDKFDWDGDKPLATPIEDIIIYEMHVRGFTRHPSSGIQHPNTYLGITEKIPYLKELGVNCIELMPIFEFDEFENSRTCESTGEQLLNYWGYSPVSFFAPKAGYAVGEGAGSEVNELKTLVKALHENGIEIILDVVFNHTAEGNEKGPTISFKGIDNDVYYILTPEGYYYNFSGTGNTFNCNHPRVRSLIIDCLRYWVTEYHIDGFRFDLASIMTRDVDGMPLSDPPLLREMTDDPILSRTKLIAEPWDADGLYHLGSFPAYGRWAEWNGKYRDTMRRFLKGDQDQVGAVAQALQGSPDLYPGRGPIATINFFTAHDGFTLMDLVSYNEKCNDANCEEGESGTNENYSWNCGYEGPTDDPEINALRRRQIKNAIAMLMVSQGTPMVLMGDEIGRSQHGNNNPYCQDSEISWMNWDQLHSNGDLFRFFRACITFRKWHSVLRNGYFLRGEDYLETGYPDISWHGTKLFQPNWSPKNLRIAFMLNGRYGKGGLAPDNHVYIALNMHWKAASFQLPPLPEGQNWHVFANTGDSGNDVYEPGQERYLENQKTFLIQERSVIILVGR